MTNDLIPKSISYRYFIDLESAGIDATKYIIGLVRDTPKRDFAHIYEGTFGDPGDPMCWQGWNRDDGESYSIWRGNVGNKGICRTCIKNVWRKEGGILPSPQQEDI